jgi:hypothetical protein
MTVIYNMSIDRADKPWIGDRRLTEARCMVRPPLMRLRCTCHCCWLA